MSAGQTRTLRDLLLIAVLFALLAAAVGPIHEFPIGDDWEYARSVQRLLANGQFYRSPLVQATALFPAAWGTLFAAGKITQAQYNDNLTQANAYNFDNSSQGWEGEVIANLTPSWRLLFNVSTNKTSLTNVATTIRSYIAANRAT